VDIPSMSHIVSAQARGEFVAGLRGPAASDDVTVPAQDGLRRDNQTQAPTAALGDDVQQEREEGPISPGRLRPRVDLALRHGELVTKEQDLRGLARLGTPDSRSHPNSPLMVK
jgi:hypothetical protein